MKNKKNLLFLLVLLSYNYLSRAQDFALLSTTKIVSSDRYFEDNFGSAVAISGDYAIVGAKRESEDALGNNNMNLAGSAYIYHRNTNGAWSEVQKIVASDRAALDRFGERVAISGNYAVVGAFRSKTDVTGAHPLTGAGAVYVFERDGSGNWNEIQKIAAPTRSINDFFGFAVALHGDQLIIGCHNDDEDFDENNFLPSAGSVYMYQLNGTGTWDLSQKITTSDRSEGDSFGYSIFMSGNQALIGAYQESGGPIAEALSGAVYVFERDGTGTWSEKQKIVTSTRQLNDEFGGSVAFHGNTAVIGAPGEDEDESEANTKNNSGAVYIFETDANGDWQEVKRIVATDRDNTDRYGESVSMLGNYIAVGASTKDEDISTLDTGAAYLLSKVDGDWEEIQKFTAPVSASEDFFGNAIALGKHGVIICAFQEEEDASEANNVKDTGSIYTYQFNSKPTDILLSNTTIEENNGIDVVVGTLGTEDNDIGDVYTYTLTSGAGDSDNNSFHIVGIELRASESFDFETKNSYAIRIKTDDGNGDTFEKELVISINDISGLSQIITLQPIANKLTTDAPFDIIASVDSGLALAYSVVGVATNSGTTITLNGTAGAVTVTVAQAGDADYGAVSEELFFEVNKVDQVITFGALADASVGDADFDLTASSSSNLMITYDITGDSDVVKMSGSTVTIVGAGTVTIIAYQSGDETYNSAVSVSQVFTVNKQAQEITFGALADASVGDADFDLTASSSSNLMITYDITGDSDVVKMSGSTVTIVGAGTVTIIAYQSGDETYNSASNVMQTLTVNKQAQEITFDAIEDQVIENGSLALAATASSELTISYEIVNGPATVSGGTVTFTGLGTVIVNASQTGDATFAEAISVEQSFQVITITRVNPRGFTVPTRTYPNPVREVLHIDLGDQKLLELSLTDLKGKQIEVNRNGASLNTASLKGGYYLLRIVTDQGISLQKIIKQ